MVSSSLLVFNYFSKKKGKKNDFMPALHMNKAETGGELICAHLIVTICLTVRKLMTNQNLHVILNDTT